MRRFWHFTITVAIVAMVAMVASAASATVTHGTAASASKERVIHSFKEGSSSYPDSDMVMDAAGNLYGTTVEGGTYGGGTVFELSPSGHGWTYKRLHSFTGQADGGQPYKGVTLDAQGDLYGTAVTGGNLACGIEGGCGVAYKLTNSGGTWTETIIHEFTGGKDGYGPGAGLTLDANGNLYGMTPTGGANGFGVIYQLAPGLGGTWSLRVIHTFSGGRDGGTGSAGRMIFDAAGNLYGVATVGGDHGAGTVFALRTTQSGRWKLKVLYAFNGMPDAGSPYGGLVFDPSGNLYGTTYYAGAYDGGAVYQLAPQPTGPWKERVLHSFQGGVDGSGPLGNLIFDAAGNMYGTTSEGGAGCSCGTIFKLTPTGGSWVESVAYRFTGFPTDGGFAYNGMTGDGAGNFYGATVHGGTDDEGAIYQFRP